MIELREVVKEFGAWPPWAGRVRALDGVSLEVPEGTALGIVGPNGAGKSTLLRLLLGFLRPSAGEVAVGGLRPRAYVERHGIGYVPDRVDVPRGWTVRGALRAFAALGDVERPHERIGEEMERLGLAPVADRRVGALSAGNLRRLALAQALLGDRRVLVLDEPQTGLDPEWMVRLRGAVAGWRAADPRRVVLLASHDLDEVERTMDRAVVLHEGRVRETVELRAAAASPTWRVEVEPAPGAEAAVREAFRAAVPEGEGAFRVAAADAAALTRGLGLLAVRGVAVRAVAPGGRLAERFRAGAEGGR